MAEIIAVDQVRIAPAVDDPAGTDLTDTTGRILLRLSWGQDRTGTAAALRHLAAMLDQEAARVWGGGDDVGGEGSN